MFSPFNPRDTNTHRSNRLWGTQRPVNDSNGSSTHTTQNMDGWGRPYYGVTTPEQTPPNPVSIVKKTLEPLDEHRIAQRMKQVWFGRVTLGYRNSRMPKDPSHPNIPERPTTPNPTAQVSKRSWGTMVSKWRRNLHLFDSVEPGELDVESCVKIEEALRWSATQHPSAQTGEDATAWVTNQFSEAPLHTQPVTQEVKKVSQWPDRLEARANPPVQATAVTESQSPSDLFPAHDDNIDLEMASHFSGFAFQFNSPRLSSTPASPTRPPCLRDYSFFSETARDKEMGERNLSRELSLVTPPTQS